MRVKWRIQAYKVAINVYSSTFPGDCRSGLYAISNVRQRRPSLRLVDLAGLHHEGDVAENRHIVQRIPGNCDHVSPHPVAERACLVGDAEQFRAIGGGSADG